MHAYVEREREREREEDTIAYAMDGGAVDPAKAVFDAGVKILGSAGVSERNARSVLGKWRKNHEDSQVLMAVMECGRAGAVDPIPWIEARLRPRQSVDLDDVFSRIGMPQ